MTVYLGNQKVGSLIVTKADTNNQNKTITENGTYTADSGYTGLGEVTVNVSGGGGSDGKFLVQVIDYDGTVLKQDHLNTGATFTLPSQPSHTGLTFQSWSSPVTITNNTVTVTNSDITIGATYTTASGLSEFDITLNTVTGLRVRLNMNGTKDWGDGTSNTSTMHAYARAGNYTITCNGSTMTTSKSSGLFGQSSSSKNYYVKDVRFGSSVTSIGAYTFSYCHSLKSITIPSSVTSIGDEAFYNCYSLTSITIPEGVTRIGIYEFNSCYSLTSITIPSSVTSIDTYAIPMCNSLTSITIPSSVTYISKDAFSNCHSLKSITIPGGVTSIGDRAFSYWYSLKSIMISEGVTSIGGYVFNTCASLTSITIPSSVTSIGQSAFSSCYSILEYDFSNHTAVPTLSDTNAFSGINALCKIKVPASLESQWKTKTNWSTYANYIVGV